MSRPGLVCCLMLILASCKPLQKNTGPEELVILPRSSWDALPAKPFISHQPVRITVHHEGTRLEVKDDAAKKIRNIQSWGMGKDRNWSDIPYHFLIAPDGTIYEGRDVNTAGETATEYDPSGHLLITCLGNFEEQEVPEKQLGSLIKLIAFTSKKYRIDINTLATHRDHSLKTTCPGKNLYAFFQNRYVHGEVKKLLKGPFKK